MTKLVLFGSSANGTMETAGSPLWSVARAATGRFSNRDFSSSASEESIEPSLLAPPRVTAHDVPRYVGENHREVREERNCKGSQSVEAHLHRCAHREHKGQVEPSYSIRRVGATSHPCGQ